MAGIRQALQLSPQYRDYIWGGDRLRPGQAPTAEAWVVHEGNQIAGGPLAGKTLAEITRLYGAELLGKRTLAITGERFPLLIKLLDCADWLSLQVHPNDEQAVRLEGAGRFGKTEAWHILEAAEGAELLGGLNAGCSAPEIQAAIQAGKPLVDCMQRLQVNTGNSLFIPAGMIHALGPGLLLYEIQQSSDITYRVYDWDRPASAGRQLHIEQALAVTDPNLTGKLIRGKPLMDGEKRTLLTSQYFNLAIFEGEHNSLLENTHEQSFQAVTVIEGRASLQGEGWELGLERFESALVPAAVGQYQIAPSGATRALLASV